MNEKLRASEDSEKQAIDLEEESKLKSDEAEKQKAESEEKLQQCLGRESQAFEDLQKLKVGVCNRWTKNWDSAKFKYFKIDMNLHNVFNDRVMHMTVSSAFFSVDQAFPHVNHSLLNFLLHF